MNRTHSPIRFLGVGLVAIAAALVASPLPAATDVGVRTGVYTDANAGFLGGEVNTTISSNWYFNPNVEYAFGDDNNDVLTVNGDVHYDFFHDRPYYVWAGAGPALIHTERNDENDFGVNLLGGIGWKTRQKVTPYVQGKVTVADDNEAVLAVGMRF